MINAIGTLDLIADRSESLMQVDEEEDDEGDGEGYETYEGYDEEEDDEKDDDLDRVDDEVEGLPEQGTCTSGVAIEGGNNLEYSVPDLNERVIEVGGAEVEDGDFVQDQAAELTLSGNSQVGLLLFNKFCVDIILVSLVFCFFRSECLLDFSLVCCRILCLY